MQLDLSLDPHELCARFKNSLVIVQHSFDVPDFQIVIIGLDFRQHLNCFVDFIKLASIF